MIQLFLPVFLLFFLGYRSTVTTAAAIETKPPDKISVQTPYKTYKLDAIDTSTSDQDPFFIRVVVELSYDANEEGIILPQLKAKEGEIKWEIINTFKYKSYKEMDTADKQEALTGELKSALNTFLTNTKIEKVRFVEFTVE